MTLYELMFGISYVVIVIIGCLYLMRKHKEKVQSTADKHE